ncbi:MAG TPA: NYN domain-containing protein [Chlamydiales bacterium]|nr:NYN domain-containing protein [Chlamydiales bacterium]
MYFLIDGYNLLFSWIEGKESIEKKRIRLIAWIQQTFRRMRLQGIIVFDGSHSRDEESGLAYPSPMELAFTPKGQSADENILERVEALKNRKSATVVTNDLGLKRQAGAFGAKTMSNDEFLDWLLKRAAKRKRKQATTKESPQEIERLTKIFEQRLKDDQ